MKISYNWLKRYLDFDFPPSIVAEAITRLGLEVEGVQTIGVAANDKLVVGEILTRDKHPNADKLSVCTVDVGQGAPLQIVCGAPNCDAGNRVPVALVGCYLPLKDEYQHERGEKNFEIKATKLRGVDSNGMMCGADEIGVEGDFPERHLLVLAGKPTLGRKVHEVLPGDTVFEVAVLPNRPDALSHWGIARDLAAKWGLKLKKIDAHKIPEKKALDFKGLSIEDPADCPHLRVYIIRGITIAPSPAWLQELLTAIGQRPINNVVDITNFILHGLGQPSHAFDLAKIQGGEIVIRRARRGEKVMVLNNKEYTLEESDLVVADAKGPLDICGIMGGKFTSMEPTTTDIALTVGQYNPTRLRKTSRRLQVSSDSSYRYERGIDPLALQPAAEQAVEMILELAGGKLDGGAIVAGQPPYVEKKFLISRDFMVEKLGFAMDCENIEEALTGFGFRLKHKGESSWEVTVPSFRLDIDRSVDLVEEVLRFHGVDRIPASVLRLPANEQQDDRLYTVTRELSRRLIALGYNECMHYTLRTRAEAERLETSPEAAALHAIENPLSAEMSCLRFSLIPALVEALELNRSRGNALEPLFEVGHVFRVRDGKLHEFQSISFVKVISPAPETWQKNTPAPDFFAAKATVESLLSAAGHSLPDARWTHLETDALWQGYHAAAAHSAHVEPFTATAGIVNFNQTKAVGFSGTVLAGEILFPLNLFQADAALKRYAAFSQFPGTRRDVALVVKSNTSAGIVFSALEKIAKEAVVGKFDVESIALFDLYQGAGIPEGHKSLAFALNFRAMDRTLTDEEIVGVFGTILENLKAAGYQVRS